ncbi:MAG: accessory gene regulator B family protein [Peptococcia bacterium]
MKQYTPRDYSIHGLGQKVGAWLAEHTDQPEKGPIYAYGAEVALGAVVKIIVAGTLAVILGILPIIALLIIATGVLRVVVGGAHCTAYYRCLIYSLISFFGLGLLLKHYLPYLTSLSSGVLILPLLACLIINLRWAPCPPENRPLRNEAEGKSKKRLAILICLVLSVVLLLAGTSHWWVWVVLLGMLSEAVTITPWGIWFVNGCDRLLAGNIKRKEAELHG